MHPRTLKTPSYRLHKPTGRAVVTLDGRDLYLGRFRSPESRAEYDRTIVEWLSNGRRLPAPTSGAGSDLTTNELALAYLAFADSYDVKHGKPTTETACIRVSIRPLRQLYGDTPAKAFGPLQLKAVRQAMIDSGLCRNEVNKRTGRIVRIIKWAVGEGMVPPSLHHGLPNRSAEAERVYVNNGIENDQPPAILLQERARRRPSQNHVGVGTTEPGDAKINNDIYDLNLLSGMDANTVRGENHPAQHTVNSSHAYLLPEPSA